jgi:hypothetical protein
VMYCTDHAQHLVKTAEEAQHELDVLHQLLSRHRQRVAPGNPSQLIMCFSRLHTRTAALPHLVQA